MPRFWPGVYEQDLGHQAGGATEYLDLGEHRKRARPVSIPSMDLVASTPIPDG